MYTHIYMYTYIYIYVYIYIYICIYPPAEAGEGVGELAVIGVQLHVDVAGQEVVALVVGAQPPLQLLQ